MVNNGSANVKSNKGKLGSYFVILTCRNSQDTIKKALESHKMQTLQADYILVVDDGSSDKTPSILSELQNEWKNLYVITHPDWGYDTRRIVKNWNECIAFCNKMHLPKTKYHLIATDDTIYSADYAERIVRLMDSRSDLVFVSGNCPGCRSNAPRGAGRFVRNSVFNELMWKGYYPEQMGYESVILYEANRKGYNNDIIHDAMFDHVRPLGADHKFYEFGASMKVLGYHPLFVFGRFLRYFLTGSTTGRKGAMYMLYYYLFYNTKEGIDGYDRLYSKEITSFIRKKQTERIKNEFLKRIPFLR